jgi:hypothetical protein
MVLEKYAPIMTNAFLIIGIVIVCLGLSIWAWWYFMIVKKRKRWFLRIWEQKSDKKLHLVGMDELEERRYDYGRRVMYWLKRYKSEATPPPIDATDRVGGKDFADYLKVRQNFVPLLKEINGDITYESQSPEKHRIVNSELAALSALKKGGKFSKPEQAQQRFVYVPLSKVPHLDVEMIQMDFDVDMMRINQIDNIDAFFTAKKNFWEKYKELLIILLGVVMVIVVAYLSFEYGKAVIAEGTAASNQQTNEIKNTNNAIWAIAKAIGGDVGNKPGQVNATQAPPPP